ncbi:hypothetical protein KAR28_00685 [Candidatus Parcubacteria bacterium]|nr:hypothetical protein [Candidatus Parcubacteria bacterium]
MIRLYEITPSITSFNGRIVEINKQEGILGIEDSEKQIKRFFYATEDGKVLLENYLESKFKIGDPVFVRNGVIKKIS